MHQLQRSVVKGNEFTPITAFDENKLKLFITQIIMKRNTVTFRFYNGVEITKEYTNGQAGNKVGWKKKAGDKSMTQTAPRVVIRITLEALFAAG